MIHPDPEYGATPKDKAPFWGTTLLRKLPFLYTLPDQQTPADVKRLEKQIKDFAGGGIALLPQRQGIYLGALFLCSFFFSFDVAIFCYLFIQLAELLDTIVSRQVMAWKGGSARMAAKFYYRLLATSTVSTMAVASFVMLVAQMEGPSEHLTSLFFLFAAGLFAAVNNHQLPKVLAVRLVIYSAVFLYIPIKDILVLRPPLNSEPYMHLATVVFVLYFVLECSMIFLRLYQNNLDQIEELRVERDRAQEVYRLKSQFVSVVSHELRTPLTSIIGALGLMKNANVVKDPAGFEKILGIANKNSTRLSRLINDLLDLQKLESDQMNYDFRPISLEDVAQDSVDAISAHADSVGVQVRLEEPEDHIHVCADYDRLLQVLDNLLSNAVKFSEKGSAVEVSIKTTDDQAILSVQDYGIGIPEGSEDVVFGTFSQVDASDHRAHEGTGLGMNIVQQIAQAHGGRVDYVSTLGKGTTFRVFLPLERDEGV